MSFRYCSPLPPKSTVRRLSSSNVMSTHPLASNGALAMRVQVPVHRAVPPGLTVNGSAFDVPPPGAASKTVTDRCPADWISAPVICAVSRVALTKLVIRAAPFQRTVETPLTKPEPFTVRVKPGPPALTAFGCRLVSMGTGLSPPDGGVTLKKSVFDVPPPGAEVTTVTGRWPAAPSVGIWAVSRVELTNAVVRATPFHHTTDCPLTNPLPFTVRVKAGAPAAAESGDRLLGAAGGGARL